MNGLKFLWLLTLVCFASCKSGAKHDLSADLVQNGKKPVITFEQKEHDFGVVTEGEILSYTFDFSNTGDGDLLLADVHGQCSCTVPEWPKDIIKPGDKGSIKVKFDTNGKSGITEKGVVIEANTNPKITNIRIKADIRKAPEKN